MRENNSKLRFFFVIFTLIMGLAGCFIVGAYLAMRFMPSFSVDPYFKYVDRGDPDEMAIVFADELVPNEYYALYFGEDALIDMDFLKAYGIDRHLFWDSAEQTLTISTPLKIIQMKPEEAFYTINGNTSPFPVENTALLSKNEKVFIPLSFITEFYQVNCEISREMKIIVVDSRLTERSHGKARRNISVRYEPDIKSDIAEKVKKDEMLYIFAGDADNFYRVRTGSGVIGYVKASDVTDITVLGAEEDTRDEAPLCRLAKGRAAIVWDQVSGPGGQWLTDAVPGINIVSPTWFSLSSADGSIKDVGDSAYAAAVKAAGYELWPLFSNSFDADLTHETLKSGKSRRQIIENISSLIDKYGADGINVDFESYRIEDGYYYTQFLREFCVYMREKGITTSIDLPVPTLKESPTDRSEIGRYADFIIVMAYDQHWASSQTKGPVAAYDWVYSGIERTLEYVPAEKVVLGLPFYTRIWYQPVGSDSVTSRDFAMSYVTDLFDLRNADMTFEENTQYYKGEYEYDISGVRNVVTAWLESSETLTGKAKIVGELGLAGIAGWKKGLEDEGIWERLVSAMR